MALTYEQEVCGHPKNTATYGDGHSPTSRKPVAIMVFHPAAEPPRIAANTTGKGRKYPKLPSSFKMVDSRKARPDTAASMAVSTRVWVHGWDRDKQGVSQV